MGPFLFPHNVHPICEMPYCEAINFKNWVLTFSGVLYSSYQYSTLLVGKYSEPPLSRGGLGGKYNVHTSISPYGEDHDSNSSTAISYVLMYIYMVTSAWIAATDTKVRGLNPGASRLQSENIDSKKGSVDSNCEHEYL